MIVRAAALIHDGDMFLLVQEGYPRNYGKWNWCQGAVEEGESVEAAALREAKEESGLTVRLEKELVVLKDPFPGTSALHVFLATPLEGTPTPNPGEILDVKYFTLHQIEQMRDQLIAPRVWEVIRSLA